MNMNTLSAEYFDESSVSESSTSEETFQTKISKGRKRRSSNLSKNKKKSDERLVKFIPFSCCHTCNHFHLSFCQCNCRAPLRWTPK